MIINRMTDNTTFHSEGQGVWAHRTILTHSFIFIEVPVSNWESHCSCGRDIDFAFVYAYSFGFENFVFCVI